MLAFIDPAAARAEIERGMTLPRTPFVTALFRVWDGFAIDRVEHLHSVVETVLAQLLVTHEKLLLARVRRGTSGRRTCTSIHST
jgi:hypothetical protein